MGDSTLSLSDFSKKSLIAFQNLNNISGWDITANRLVFGSIKKPLNIHPNAYSASKADDDAGVITLIYSSGLSTGGR